MAPHFIEQCFVAPGRLRYQMVQGLPYPLNVLHDGARLTLRPICPGDEPAMIRFHRSLSDRSIYLRYFHQISLSERVAHERLAGVCSTDQDRALVVVAETEHIKTSPAWVV